MANFGFANKLWFDVGIKRYTTVVGGAKSVRSCGLSVGIKRYTTNMKSPH